jgi:putative ABC transport system substrate-binding protein
MLAQTPWLTGQRMHFRRWKRRQFITLLGGAAVAWPLAVRAQQGERMRRIGVLTGASRNDPAASIWASTFERALQELGWTEGRNLKIEYRFAGGDLERIRLSAAELVGMPAEVILSGGTLTTKALKQETLSIPIVFVQASDPVGDAFVESLARPGGNITGFPNVESSMSSKWLELLKEIAPQTVRVGLMFNPDAAPRGGAFFAQAVEAAAPSLFVQMISAPARSAEDIETTVIALARGHGGGLIVAPDSFITPRRGLIVAMAARHALPAVYPFREFAVSGGLISYGADSVDLWRRAASYVDRILRGEKPSELPVQAPTKFELVINLNTARALGLTVPDTLLARADEVIE